MAPYLGSWLCRLSLISGKFDLTNKLPYKTVPSTVFTRKSLRKTKFHKLGAISEQ